MTASRITSWAGASFALFLLTACPRPPLPLEPTPTPAPTPLASPTPTPPPYVPAKRLDVGRIFNGMQYRVTLETELGGTATDERNDPASYRAELVVKVKVPKPHQNLEEISKLNRKLPGLLPSLSAMIGTGKISPAYDELYRLKCNTLKSSMDRLDTLLTRHNFFDCETLLELQHPETKRRVLFIQSDMDVDTDGSDVDRVPLIEGASSTFQPFTSYRWAKRTENVSPLISPREGKLRDLETELVGNPTAARREAIRASISALEDDIKQLKRFSFLIGHADPFIVLPASMLTGKGPFVPSVGDYCVVIYDGTLYPAIVGDAGPRMKMGEGSLRLCKQILPKANGDFRAVSDLRVTYLVFPGTADRPFAVPDLAKWQAKCAKLVEEIGGHQGELFTWEDVTLPKAPPATPVPATPAPVATPPVP